MKDNTEPREDHIVVVGVSPEGKVFRPTNWPERIAGLLSTFEGHRIHYSPLLRPGQTKEGFGCIIMSTELLHHNKALYDYVISFSKENNLTLQTDSNICIR